MLRDRKITTGKVQPQHKKHKIQKKKERKRKWRQILISNLIDTTELKPKGKLFHTFRNVVPKPGLNSLTNFQQHCLKRGKHY